MNTKPFPLESPVDKRRNVLRETTKKPWSVPKKCHLTKLFYALISDKFHEMEKQQARAYTWEYTTRKPGVISESATSGHITFSLLLTCYLKINFHLFTEFGIFLQTWCITSHRSPLKIILFLFFQRHHIKAAQTEFKTACFLFAT
jgi:hypothetical protein